MSRFSQNLGSLAVLALVFCFPSSLLAEGGGIMSPHPGLMFWTIITFVVVLVLLRSTAWKPLLESLDKREKTIHDAIENAKKRQQEAEELLKEYQEKIAKAETEMRELIDKGREAAQATKDKMVSEANEECQRIRERNENEIKLAKEQAIQDIFKVAAEVSVAISTKLVKKSLDEKQQNEIIKEALEEFKSANLN